MLATSTIDPGTSQDVPGVSKQRARIWTPHCRWSHLTGDKDMDGKETEQRQSQLQLNQQESTWICLAFGQVPRTQG